MSDLRVGNLELREADVPLLQFAAVVAALGEELELAGVLSLEGLDMPCWQQAAKAWTGRLGEEQALFAVYRQELELAEDRLARTVLPLDRDFAAWLGFHAAWLSDPDPAQWLATTGLRAADLSRLARGWKKRARESESMAKQIQAAESTPADAASDAVALSIGEALLQPSAAARPRHDKAQQPAAALHCRDADTVRLSLRQYAWLDVRLSQLRAAGAAERQLLLSTVGIKDRDVWPFVQAAWRARLQDDGKLAADFAILASYFKARRDVGPEPLPAIDNAADSAASPPPIVQSSPGYGQPGGPAQLRSAIDTTSDVIPALRDAPVLPFVAGGDNVVLLISLRGAVNAMPAHQQIGATALATPMLDDSDVLPFEPLADSSIPASPASLIDITAHALDAALLGLDALPFEDGEIELAPPEPPVRRNTGTHAVPQLVNLTVEQYASLCAELAAAAPAHYAAVYARYYLTTMGQYHMLHAHWQARMQADVRLKQRWGSLFRHYSSYLEGAVGTAR